MLAAYETEAQGRSGGVHAFEKPWCMVLLMFTGEAQHAGMRLPACMYQQLSCASQPREPFWHCAKCSLLPGSMGGRITQLGSRER
jgi:hypothetical protein